MKYKASNVLIPIYCAVMLVFASCEHDSNGILYNPNTGKDTNQYFIFDTVPNDRYFEQDPLPAEYQFLYGKWELLESSGGLDGNGYWIEFDTLEFRPNGLYALNYKGDIYAYGTVQVDIFDTSRYQPKLQIEVNSTHFVRPVFDGPSAMSDQFYVTHSNDSLLLYAPCCDRYNFRFKRIP